MTDTKELVERLTEQLMYKVNAPMFIYKIAYGKYPDGFMPGRTSHMQHDVDGIMVDVGIPEQVIKDLNSMPSIEMRASCQGESKIKPAFIVFRPKNKSKAEKIVEKLNKNKDLTAGYDVGNGGEIRIGVTNKAIYGQSKKTDKWWEALPAKVKKAL